MAATTGSTATAATTRCTAEATTTSSAATRARTCTPAKGETTTSPGDSGARTWTRTTTKWSTGSRAASDLPGRPGDPAEGRSPSAGAPERFERPLGLSPGLLLAPRRGDPVERRCADRPDR